MARTPLCQNLPVLQVGTVCRLNPVFLHPTQHTAGLKAVDSKKEKLIGKIKKSRAKLEKYLKKKTVPVVLGAKFQGRKRIEGISFYMTDGHHTMRAFSELNLNYPAYIRVTHDLRHLDFRHFWTFMTREKLVYHKKHGKIQLVETLPKTLYRLIDDPYRSLSWEVREQGCYLNLDNIAFQEFFWADFFRKKVDVNDLEAAKELAISDLASELPGFTGKCERQE